MNTETNAGTFHSFCRNERACGWEVFAVNKDGSLTLVRFWLFRSDAMKHCKRLNRPLNPFLNGTRPVVA